MNLHNRMWWTGDLSNQLNSHTLSPKLRFHKNGRTGEYLMRWYLVKKYQKVSNVLNTNVSGLWPFFGGRKTVARWICLSSDDGPWQAFCLSPSSFYYKETQKNHGTPLFANSGESSREVWCAPTSVIQLHHLTSYVLGWFSNSMGTSFDVRKAGGKD